MIESLEYVPLSSRISIYGIRRLQGKISCTYHGQLLNVTHAVWLNTQSVGALLLKAIHVLPTRRPEAAPFRALLGLDGACVLIVAEAIPCSTAFAFFAKSYRETWSS